MKIWKEKKTVKVDGIIYQLQTSIFFRQRVIEAFPGCNPGKSRISPEKFEKLWGETLKDLEYGYIYPYSPKYRKN